MATSGGQFSWPLGMGGPVEGSRLKWHLYKDNGLKWLQNGRQESSRWVSQSYISQV